MRAGQKQEVFPDSGSEVSRWFEVSSQEASEEVGPVPEKVCYCVHRPSEHGWRL